MVKFQMVKQGYRREEVEEYIDMLAIGYEALQKELKAAKEENQILKRKKKRFEEKNKKLEEKHKRLEERSKRSAYEKESLSYQETIEAAMKGAEVSGKWIIEEAKKEAFGIQKAARSEVRIIKKGKKEALREVRVLARKLQSFLEEEQDKTKENKK